MSTSLAERIERRIAIVGDCWQWTGSIQSAGYGKLKVDGRNVLAHRVSYEAHVGPIPDGQVIDHLCRNRACVNPAHLEPVTARENTMRGESHVAREAVATHCIHGHEFTPANTLTKRRRNGTTFRNCRACKNGKTAS